MSTLAKSKSSCGSESGTEFRFRVRYFEFLFSNSFEEGTKDKERESNMEDVMDRSIESISTRISMVVLT